MQAVSYLIGAAVLGVNVHAVVALVLGIRAQGAPVIARHARRCAWSAAGFALLAALGLVVSVLTHDEFPGDDPAPRAARLAMLISELINTAAFAVLTAAFPLIVAAVLSLRTRRAQRDARTPASSEKGS